MEKDDKLITEFMGVKYLNQQEYAKITGCPDNEIDNMPKSNCNYHVSWDALMPVYHKIVGEELFGNDEEGIILFNIIYDRLGDGCSIEEVRKSIIDFIKWYNEY